MAKKIDTTQPITMKSLFENKFLNIPKTFEGIKAAAEYLLANKWPGQGSPEGWAKSALERLKNYDKVDPTQLVIPRNLRGERDKLKDERTRWQREWQNLSDKFRLTSSGQNIKAKYDAARAAEQNLLQTKGISQQQYILEEAYSWITGSAQPHRKERV